MPNYRLYCLDGSGRITGVPELIEAPSDEAAMAEARALDLGICELWQGRRLVGKLGADARQRSAGEA